MIDVDYIADGFADDSPIRNDHVQTVPAPLGATWNEVRIIFHDALMQVMIRGRKSERNYSQAGFRDPDQRLELLKLFAAARGTLDNDRIASLLQGETPARKRVSRLRQLLQELIEVDGDPIEHNKKANTYSCQFEIRLARDHGYPTPERATWVNFSFHERADGRLNVSVTEKHRFRARDYRTEDGRPTNEVAEREASSGCLYSLEELGLRTPAGKLTPEGTALVGFLRGGARLRRRGDDLAVLGLSKLLREWASIEGQPLQFSEAARSWTALFACSSEIAVE